MPTRGEEARERRGKKAGERGDGAREQAGGSVTPCQSEGRRASRRATPATGRAHLPHPPRQGARTERLSVPAAAAREKKTQKKNGTPQSPRRWGAPPSVGRAWTAATAGNSGKGGRQGGPTRTADGGLVGGDARGGPPKAAGWTRRGNAHRDAGGSTWTMPGQAVEMCTHAGRAEATQDATRAGRPTGTMAGNGAAIGTHSGGTDAAGREQRKVETRAGGWGARRWRRGEMGGEAPAKGRPRRERLASQANRRGHGGHRAGQKKKKGGQRKKERSAAATATHRCLPPSPPTCLAAPTRKSGGREGGGPTTVPNEDTMVSDARWR